MYPTIYHALYDLFGFDWTWTKMFNSFGFFVAIAFVVASTTLSWELKRKENLGQFKAGVRDVIKGMKPNWSDIATSGVLGFVLGWKFIYLVLNSSQLFQAGQTPQRHIFSSEGYWLLGLVVGAAMAGWRYWEYKKQELPTPVTESVKFHAHEHTGTITFIAAIGGLAGAKLFHLFENPKEFMEFFTNPSLEGFISGLTVYGGLIVGAAAVLTYAWRKGLNLLHLSDAATPGMILAYGIGRIGCQVSGDGDWGIVNLAPAPSWLPQWMWSYNYPNNVNREGVMMLECDPHFSGYCTELPQGVFPTPLYETLMAVGIFFILWTLRKRINTAGVITSLYLLFNGLERLLIEQIRVNNKFDFLGMKVTQAEIIACVFILSGAALLFYFIRKSKSPKQTVNSVV